MQGSQWTRMISYYGKLKRTQKIYDPVSENYIFSKTQEIDGLIKAKSSEVVRHLNENFKTLLCIDISCELLNIPFNTSQAILTSSVRKREYNNNRKILLKILNLDKKMTISDVILKLGILQSTTLEKTAHKIFEQYRSEHAYSEEVNHISILTMCVYYAAKVEKVKIAKKNILTISSLNSAQWNGMMQSWSTWANIETKKKKVENVQEVEKDQEMNEESRSSITKAKNNEEESYEIWAKRILEKAHAELKILKKQKTIQA